MTPSDLTQILDELRELINDELRELKEESKKQSNSLVRVLEIVRECGDTDLINQVCEVIENGMPDRLPAVRH